MIPTYKPKKITAKKVTFKKSVSDRLTKAKYKPKKVGFKMIGENTKAVKVKKYTPKKVAFKKIKAKKCCMRK